MASVLAMMFVVLFGSLSVAMAIVSKGNLRTAQTHLHVIRAMNAAETGMDIARQRLARAVQRFVVSKGVVDEDFGEDIWAGTLDGGDGTVTVRAPQGALEEDGDPAGIASALLSEHDAESNLLALPGFPESATIHDADDGADDSIFRMTDWVTTPAIAIDGSMEDGISPAAYQITYAPLANGTDIRVIVTGFSSLNSSGSSYHYGGQDESGIYRPLSRTISADFRIAKRHKHAIISPSRIMIGKDVSIVGDLGATYTDVDENNGHPMVVRSDFHGMDSRLDAQLDDFFEAVEDSDVDADNRLRVGHSIEGEGLPPAADYDGDGATENPFTDITGDGAVDEFDLFINRFDADHDGRIVLSASLTAGTAAEGSSPEFTLDDDLALLIDSANPDRNRNRVYGYQDDNLNGRWDEGEAFNDLDARHDNAPADQILGYRDGFIDRKDQYSKVKGRLVMRVEEQDWSAEQGDYQQYIQGPIVPTDDESPILFDASDEDLPPVDVDTFVDAESALQDIADGDTFAEQVAAQLSIQSSDLATYTETDTDSTHARYFRANMDDATVYSMTGRHLYEKMPFNAPTFTDWYVRPRYENMVFKNVEIPRGTNALFNNCTFVGVTWVRTYEDNTHENWSHYGKMQVTGSTGAPAYLTAPLDKSDFLRYTTGNVVDGPANYDDFPNPPVIDGAVKTGDARNTKLYSNNIRFHDCLFVGSIISDSPDEFTNIRNKMQFTGSTRFTTEHPDDPDDPDLNPDEADIAEIIKSSMMLPNYSVDIGSFNSPTDTFGDEIPGQNVQLTGTIVAGLLDIRGTTSIDGTLLLTFAPTAGQGPLQLDGQPVGNPASFNTTLGYFGPDDGDEEALDPADLPTVGGVKIVGYDLDGDGIADTEPEYTPTAAELDAGAEAVPFYGYGRVMLKWNPTLPMPDGIMLPLSVVEIAGSYREGR